MSGCALQESGIPFYITPSNSSIFASEDIYWCVCVLKDTEREREK